MSELALAEEGRAGLRPPPETQGQRSGFPWLDCMGFAILTFNSGMAIYHSGGNAGSICFVLFSYLDLVLLFFGLRAWERPGDPHTHSGRVRKAVWTLTALLIVMLSCKVAAIMPLQMAAIVWAMAAAGLVGSFYAFFASPPR